MKIVVEDGNNLNVEYYLQFNKITSASNMKLCAILKIVPIFLRDVTTFYPNLPTFI